MGTLLKIQEYFLGNLNNSEYANHLNRFRSLFVKKESGGDDRPVIESVDVLIDSAALNIPEEMVTAFDADMALLDDLVNQSRTSDETALLAEEDKNRDDLVVYFTTSVSQMRKSPIAAQKNAAISLYNQAKTYVGMAQLADQQETQQINGLLLDMEKEPNKTNVGTLGLAPVLEALKASNQRFIDLTAQRTANRAATQVENSKIIRARLDPIYEDMTSLATATHLLTPTADTAAFVTAVNALIGETKARYNQRIGVAKANKNKAKPDDRPVIE